MDILTTLQILGLFCQHGLGEANVSRDVRVDARTHSILIIITLLLVRFQNC